MLVGFFLGCALTICSVVVLLILDSRVEKEPTIDELPFIDVKKIGRWIWWGMKGYYHLIIEPWFWLWMALDLGDDHAKIRSRTVDAAGPRLTR